MNNLSLNSIGNKVLIDSEGELYGHIKDAYFEKTTFDLLYFIIQDRMTNESDLILTRELISKSTEEAIYLKIRISDLMDIKDLTDEEKIDIITLTDLKNQDIYDEDLNIVGKITDVLFGNDDDYEFELGGEKFTNLLEENACSELLTYSVKIEDLEYREGRIILIQSLRTIEARIKSYLDNIQRDLYLVASDDDKITEDEQQLMEEVIKGMMNYDLMLFGMTKGNPQHIDALEKFKDLIMIKMIGKAKMDHIISVDERRLICKFAGHFRDPEKIIKYITAI